MRIAFIAPIVQDGAPDPVIGVASALADLGHRVVEVRSHGGLAAVRSRDDGRSHIEAPVPLCDALERCEESDAVLIVVGADGDTSVCRDAMRRLAGRRLVLVDPEASCGLSSTPSMGARPAVLDLHRFERVLVCSGGPRRCAEYARSGARLTVPIRWTAASGGIGASLVGAARYAMTLIPDLRRGADDVSGVRLLYGVAQNHPDKEFCVVGVSGATGLPSNVRVCAGTSTAEAVDVMQASRLVFVSTSERLRRHGFCPRPALFDAALSGACVVSDAWQGLKEFYEIGREILVCSSERDLSLCLDALGDEAVTQMARAGAERTLADHTYRHRAAELIQAIGAVAPSSTYLPASHMLTAAA